MTSPATFYGSMQKIFDCPVCFDPQETGYIHLNGGEKHPYCKNCLTTALNQKKECPSCRKLVAGIKEITEKAFKTLSSNPEFVKKFTSASYGILAGFSLYYLLQPFVRQGALIGASCIAVCEGMIHESLQIDGALRGKAAILLPAKTKRSLTE